MEKLLKDYMNDCKEFEALVESVPEKAVDFKPGPGRWSIREIVSHNADAEMVLVYRIKMCIAEPGSVIQLYDENKWADALKYDRIAVESSLAVIKAVRKVTLELLEKLPEQYWALTLEHPETGKMALAALVEYATEHIRTHIRQIKNNLAAWKDENR